MKQKREARHRFWEKRQPGKTQVTQYTAKYITTLARRAIKTWMVNRLMRWRFDSQWQLDIQLAFLIWLRFGRRLAGL